MRETFSFKNIAFVNKLRERFKLQDVPDGLDLSLEKAEVFRLLVSGRGKGKPHCSKHYPKHEGKVRGS